MIEADVLIEARGREGRTLKQGSESGTEETNGAYREAAKSCEPEKKLAASKETQD